MANRLHVNANPELVLDGTSPIDCINNDNLSFENLSDSCSDSEADYGHNSDENSSDLEFLSDSSSDSDSEEYRFFNQSGLDNECKSCKKIQYEFHKSNFLDNDF